jgi:purine-binding chemotaxis protein CheW
VTAAPGDGYDVLVLEVAGHRYGLLAADVEKVERAVTVVPLPGAPAVVAGVINVRGAVVVVLDLRLRFGLPGKAVEPSDHLVIVTTGDRRVAVHADRVTELRRIAGADIERAPIAISGVGYVAGVAKVEDGLLLIHDLRTFLSQGEAAALDAALEETGAP